MDLNIYLVEWLAKERLGEVQAAVVRERLAASLRPRPSLRVALGVRLISLGQRLQGVRASALPTGPPAAS